MAADKESASGFIEQTVFLPRRLWTQIEILSDRASKDPSEIIAEAVRLLIAGGASAPASVGGTKSGDTGDTRPDIAAVATADTTQVEGLLSEVVDEKLGSDTLRDCFQRVMAAVEERDSFINSHSEAVADLARRTAEVMGLDDGEAAVVSMAGLVHDLGKLRVPEEVLGKRGKLTPDEWLLVKRYPQFGAELLHDFTHLGEVVPLVKAHQERWDGSGYPIGLEGDAIPIGAQIVGICDVYHVLTSERAYRPALSPEIARRTIEGGSGRLWNPELVTKFLSEVIR